MKKIFIDGKESAATMVTISNLRPGDFHVPLAVLDRTNSTSPGALRRVKTIEPATHTGFVLMAYDHPYLSREDWQFQRIFSETMFVYRLEPDRPL